MADARGTCLALALLLVGGSDAGAGAIVSVDFGGGAGSQNTAQVALGDSIYVDIWLADVVDPEVQLAEFTLGFDPEVVSLADVFPGTFFPSELLFIFEVTPSEGSVQVSSAMRTFPIPSGQTGSGALATLLFEAVGVGESVLDLESVLLTPPARLLPDPPFIEPQPPFPPDETTDGVLTVVPEPSSGGLLLGTLLAIAGWRRRLGLPPAR